MALNNLGLGFVFRAKDMATGTIRRISGSFAQMEGKAQKASISTGQAFATLAAGAVAMGTGIAVLRASFAAADAAGEFGKKIATVGAVSRASAEDLAKLEQAAIQAGIATQFSPAQAAEGLQNLAQAGFNATESISALGPALDLAAGGQISVKDSSDALTSALAVFKLEAGEAGNVTDKLLRITNSTKLSADDLAIAMGNVGRGAVLAQQSINEMLPAIGLVKNTGVDASVASNAVSSALIFMAKNAKKFKAVGVEVTDAQGRFRPFLDIVKDTEDALGNKFPNAATRAAKATALFGRFGVSAFTGTLQALSKGLKDTNGNILRGRDAIAFLRSEMKNAGGTAEDFRKQILNTFAGQQILLEGTIETLKIALGKPFAQVLKPVVKAVTDTINLFIRGFTEMPAPIKKAIVGLTLSVGALLTAFGGFVVVSSIVAFLLPFLASIKLVMASILAVALPIVGALAAMAVVAGLLFTAGQADIGGFGTFIGELWAKFKLFFEGVKQLMTQGGFSGAVREELNKVENQGVRNFVIRVGQLLFRLQRVGEGVAEGFKVAFMVLEPVFIALVFVLDVVTTALSKMGQAMGLLATGPSEDFLDIGRALGFVLGGVVAAAMTLIAIKVAVLAVGMLALAASTLVAIAPWIALAVAIFGVVRAVQALIKLGDKLGGSVFEFFNPGALEGRGGGQTSLGPQVASLSPEALAAAASGGGAAPASAAQAAGITGALAQAGTSAAAIDPAAIARMLDSRPTVLKVELDGEQIAASVQNANRNEGARGGSPVSEE